MNSAASPKQPLGIMSKQHRATTPGGSRAARLQHGDEVVTGPMLPELNGLPLYDDAATYLRLGDRTLPWEFNGWDPESTSWKTGCYIHAGLSGFQINFEGPEVLDFWAAHSVNSYAKFPIGSLKHAVMCTPAGLIASHAILQRNGEEELRLFASGLPWAQYQASMTKFRIKAQPVPGYLHQVAGPNSLALLEQVAGESLRDIAFLRFRAARIAGLPVDIARIGMSGNLAYEVRGPLAQGPQVYDAIYRAGREFGIERLGRRAYFVNHVEGGFPQAGWTFFSAGIEDPGFRARAGRALRITGSVDPANMRARYRTPSEVGWGKTVRLDHDFMGREAIESELAAPRRTIATLRWNPQDVIDIYASLLQPGERYRSLDMPTTPSWHGGFLPMPITSSWMAVKSASPPARSTAVTSGKSFRWRPSMWNSPRSAPRSPCNGAISVSVSRVCARPWNASRI